ncbi:metallophosphoesterase [Plantactinospora sp. KLBMP9567]|uniref:metallophosphoesterase family protein n=1 Tax=Plantactinospora sp. KLBMP9567 TaxID=3085900 RepID=UPI0029811CB4|nr:metallophosphoesterase [Plantactinospora sp. KLBMP9567]MDW5325234.1 metallophosphoesterase [Plantactinospora sp. KLBMP9567]
MTEYSAPLLCEPYLLDPGPDGVWVAWHTEEPGTGGFVLIGPGAAGMSPRHAQDAASGDQPSGPGWRRFVAETRPLSRTREDAESRVPGRSYPTVTRRPVYRHLARVTGLPPGRTPYRVVALHGPGRVSVTATYSLAPAAPAGAGVRLLLTSDHQLKAMTAANLEKVAETVGVRLDGVLMAGDMVNVGDRASDWFDAATGPAFFASMTGRAEAPIAGRTYRGAPLLQHTPIFPAIGNHEVMGRWSEIASLDSQFNDPQPRDVARERYRTDGSGGSDGSERSNGSERSDGSNGSDEDEAEGGKAEGGKAEGGKAEGGKAEGGKAELGRRSWDVTTYEELFPYPRSAAGGPRWWSRTIGDVHLVTLFVTSIWRPHVPVGRGKFQEDVADLAHPERWGHGQFIFEPVHRGSAQYRWLEQELTSAEARAARFRVVMFHHPSHGLGGNSAPPYTDPVRTVERAPATGAVTAVRYAYPLAEDHILRDLEPLFSATGVHLVHNGHAHLWNRFRNPAGVNWLETSNVGNNYGAYDVSSGAARHLPAGPDYVRQGDPGGLAPVVPTIAPLTGPTGTPLPYVASDDITVFSVLDSAAGVVRSYRFDTRDPDAPVLLFDEFPLA